MSLTSSGQLSVLLATAQSAGTIAAVRQLGASNIRANVIKSLRPAPAAWSRHVARKYAAPPESESAQFLERLLEIGAADPGQILLPTSDETAWLYTVNAARLAEHFRVYQPSIESMTRILDKNLFADAATRAGVAIVPSWHPRTLEEVNELAGQLPYPILIKPTTHVHRVRNDKGNVVDSKSELMQQYQRFLDREQYGPDNHLLPDASLPILQQFVDVKDVGVHSVSGFIDQTGELFVTRRSIKVFQRSQPVGVGVCFESLPAEPELSEAVRGLCKELGYFGIFEVEFVRLGERWATIDFNPRLFNQVGMDIRRGMPLPLLACLDAAGETAALREEVEKAQKTDDTRTVFCDRFTLRAILMARTLTGRISGQERAYWNAWLNQNEAHAADFAADGNDRMPGAIHALLEIYLGVKAFRKFLRSIPRESSHPVTTSVSAAEDRA